MNKRIEELAEQCREQHGRGFGNGISRDYDETFDEDKFAELIVKECMKLNSQVLSISAIERLLPLYKEHFGVEQ